MPTELETKISEGITAQEAGNYALALVKFRSAKALIASKPNLNIRARGQSWNASAIDMLIAEMKQALAMSTGIQRQKVKWGGPQT